MNTAAPNAAPCQACMSRVIGRPAGAGYPLRLLARLVLTRSKTREACSDALEDSRFHRFEMSWSDRVHVHVEDHRLRTNGLARLDPSVRERARRQADDLSRVTLSHLVTRQRFHPSTPP